MEIDFTVASTDEHFEQILKLQKQNHFSTIRGEQKAQQIFVFAQHTLPLLQRMSSYLPQVIALHQGKVIGYNLGMPLALRDALPSLVPMFAEFERSLYQGKPLAAYRYMVGGQVCVDQNFRGRGLLSRLYHETRNRLEPGYRLCVTEVAARNTISLHAHQKMGFEVVGTYDDGQELWNVVVWDFEALGLEMQVPAGR